jgi:hypothetical protein
MNSAIIWGFAGVLAAACFARALNVKSSSHLAEMFWYSFGAFFLASASLLWVSLEDHLMIQHKIVVGALGAILGCLTLLTLAEWIKPSSAIAQVSPNPPSSPPPWDGNMGATHIEGSPNGGTGADVSVTGSGTSTPNVGMVAPNGMDIRANGGTGLKITVDGKGSAIGVISGPIRLSP